MGLVIIVSIRSSKIYQRDLKKNGFQAVGPKTAID